MTSRMKLQKKLYEIANNHKFKVYFQPPATLTMSYPCIVYEYSQPLDKKADNRAYLSHMQYQVTFITKDQDTTIPREIKEKLTYCSQERIFVTDGLYHFPFTVHEIN